MGSHSAATGSRPCIKRTQEAQQSGRGVIGNQRDVPVKRCAYPVHKTSSALRSRLHLVCTLHTVMLFPCGSLVLLGLCRYLQVNRLFYMGRWRVRTAGTVIGLLRRLGKNCLPILMSPVGIGKPLFRFFKRGSFSMGMQSWVMQLCQLWFSLVSFTFHETLLNLSHTQRTLIQLYSTQTELHLAQYIVRVTWLQSRVSLFKYSPGLNSPWLNSSRLTLLDYLQS